MCRLIETNVQNNGAVFADWAVVAKRVGLAVDLPVVGPTLSWLRTFNQMLVNRPVMTEQPSTLYAKLLGETAPITWQELQPFFARGALLWVAGEQDLIEVALGVAEDDRAKVAAWLQAGLLVKVEESRAEDLLARDPQLWAVVVAPWVLIQERAAAPSVH